MIVKIRLATESTVIKSHTMAVARLELVTAWSLGLALPRHTRGEVEPATPKSPRRGEIRLQLAHEKIKAGQNNLQQGGQPPAGTRASTPERGRATSSSRLLRSDLLPSSHQGAVLDWQKPLTWAVMSEVWPCSTLSGSDRKQVALLNDAVC